MGKGEKCENGSHILYVNDAYRGDTPIGKRMHDFSCTGAADMYYDMLAGMLTVEKMAEYAGISLDEAVKRKAE